MSDFTQKASELAERVSSIFERRKYDAIIPSTSIIAAALLEAYRKGVEDERDKLAERDLEIKRLRGCLLEALRKAAHHAEARVKELNAKNVELRATRRALAPVEAHAEGGSNDDR